MFLQDISQLSLYLFYLQSVAILIIWIFILQQISKLIRSVRELQTFRNSNSTTLRRIGRYCFLIFILTAFRWAETETGSFIGIYINYLPVLFMLGAFILAEIFEEGNKLYEAEQLTI
ncbi:DUF2975 domain-containing protein [Pontibacter cellulosilyticus]|uniref:DUF2975 domain-containing protein n=1 Tax=Pontibacter cellulosilyticus TaxID=1720253 RepID=A0A923N778_9BACT|nr:DUF2975 domain-containing protein [Pontibacter cellulosilyticus]MBC5993483.1 DUF2975 domain-containing protein [Pontibacter cellulosilyticus]